MTARRTAIFFAADTRDDCAVVADSIRLPHGDFFAPDVAESLNGTGVARDVPVALHVDLSTAVVHVTDLLRLCGRHGDFYFADELGDFIFFANRQSTITNRRLDVRAEFIFLADTAG